MGEVIKFPTTKEIVQPENTVENVNDSTESKVLEFKRGTDLDIKTKNIKACLFEDFPVITIGGEIVVEINGKKYSGAVTDILQKDTNNNITKIAYTIPFLSGDDPLKFGEADFTYEIKSYD